MLFCIIWFVYGLLYDTAVLDIVLFFVIRQNYKAVSRKTKSKEQVGLFPPMVVMASDYDACHSVSIRILNEN